MSVWIHSRPVGLALYVQGDEIPQACPPGLHGELFAPHRLASIHYLPDSGDGRVRMQVTTLDLLDHAGGFNPRQSRRRILQAETLANAGLANSTCPSSVTSKMPEYMLERMA